MSKTNYLQTVKSDLQRTAGNRCAIARCAGSPIVSAVTGGKIVKA